MLWLGKEKINNHESDLFLLSHCDFTINKKNAYNSPFCHIALLFLGITRIIDLFIATSLALLIFIAVKVLQFDDFKKNFDLDLAILLIASLVIGLALIVLGAANCVASGVLRVSGSGSIAAIPLLFVGTLIIISVISNTATVAIVFPIAVSLAAQLHISSTQVFVDIAFASSCCFIMSIVDI